MSSLRLYCQHQCSDNYMTTLQDIESRWQVPFEIKELSTNGAFDEERERLAYEQDFKPQAEILNKATGWPITKLRSNTGTYNVSNPETLAVLDDNGKIVWWCHSAPKVASALKDILTSGSLPV